MVINIDIIKKLKEETERYNRNKSLDWLSCFLDGMLHGFYYYNKNENIRDKINKFDDNLRLYISAYYDCYDSKNFFQIIKSYENTEGDYLCDIFWDLLFDFMNTLKVCDLHLNKLDISQSTSKIREMTLRISERPYMYLGEFANASTIYACMLGFAYVECWYCGEEILNNSWFDGPPNYNFSSYLKESNFLGDDDKTGSMCESDKMTIFLQYLKKFVECDCGVDS